MTENPTILITGGTGFAGSHLVDELQKQGHEKIHVTSFGNNTSYVHQVLPSQQIHPLDLTNPEPTKKLLEKIKPDQIYHLAATAAVGSSFNQVKKTIDNNFALQLSLLEAVRETCPETRILIIGSALEYQPQTRPLKETDPLGPVNPYGVSKVLQDTLGYSYARSYKLDIVRCRPFNHIGERQATGFVVPDFALQIAKIEQEQSQPIIKVGNLEAKRDFSDVKDVAKAYSTLMQKGQTSQVYNIGSGQAYSIKKLLEMMLELAKTKIEIKIDQSKFRPLDVPLVVADNSKIKELGWQPQIPIKQTLKRVLNYYRQNIQKFTN